MTDHPPLRLKIDMDALAANWRWFRDRAGVDTGAAVKTNGYGLGANAVAARLATEGCSIFYVTTWAEAAAFDVPPGASLRILHGVLPDQASVARASNAIPVLNSPEQLQLWREIAPNRPCDVMVDTGMNRLGISWRDFRTDMLDGLNINIVHSHLACADEPNNPMNFEQMSRFREIAGTLPGVRMSLSGSGGVCLGKDYAFDHVRPGLGLYGGVPNPAASGHIRQVVRPETQVIQTRTIPSGDIVGYGATWQARRETRLAAFNLGYGDGYLRSFAGAGEIIVAGKRLPIVGRVSMDIVVADVTEAAPLREGDWVEVAYDLKTASTASHLSQYELLTCLGPRYERIYI